MKPFIVFDVESYPNYFLVCFENVVSRKKLYFEARGENECLSENDRGKIKRILSGKMTMGFNSRNYDIPMLSLALQGASASRLNFMSNKIVTSDLPHWEIEKLFGVIRPKIKTHCDLQEPAPGVKVSLKLYGGRIHSQKLQDLPYSPETVLSDNQMDAVARYCFNDTDVTIDLYHSISDRIDLRFDMSEQYGLDLLSKSDAQIAEAVIKEKLNESRVFVKRPSIAPGTELKYKAPDWVTFKTQQLRDIVSEIESCSFKISNNGKPDMSPQMKGKKITIGKSVYKLGMGGLHSNEKAQHVVARENEVLCERDVASMYPSIIINLGLYPKHIGPRFLKIYTEIVKTRLKAKHEGNKVVNESLKVTINGSFGKLGSKYSILYSPDLMLKVTLTGQLSLLMLIERLELNGIEVVSANTDGVVSIMDKSQYELFDSLCFDWEMETGMDLEENSYKALYSANVNNYLAVTESKPKTKGLFVTDQLTKNPQAPICQKAVIAYLVEGKNIAETVQNSTSVTDFLTVRTVNGGAEWKGQPIGKVVRWINAVDGDVIRYVKNGNKVPKSDIAYPLNDLPDTFPKNIDYDWYVNEAMSILKDIGLN